MISISHLTTEECSLEKCTFMSLFRGIMAYFLIASHQMSLTCISLILAELQLYIISNMMQKRGEDMKVMHS